MPAFEVRAIAFLDVLGFTALTRQAEIDSAANARMDALIKILDDHVQFDPQTYAATVPAGAAPLHTFISDSIVISARLQNPDGIDGLATVVAKTIQLSHKLLEAGFIISGGVSIGNAAHTRANIFGTGYIEAFKAQEAEAGARVVLTKTATDHWLRLPFHASSMLVRRDREVAIVDTFHSYYIAGNNQLGRIEQAYQAYRTSISANVTTLDPKESPWKKWADAQRLFEEAKQRHQVHI